eukprot:CAMPEP_0114141726 /NCGR_PEP_ID=MMETSP0043_2-20121206/18062_1 /TAXON_ID=464988 /ORGANISM="Hemiselmis andersenii, Strain CCMP644" /LENGTH=109 /DNA_ID=CAMNT_0001235887 /DNA_START=300 /DNA_END=629 /DNA_ORIENTATION=+
MQTVMPWSTVAASCMDESFSARVGVRSTHSTPFLYFLSSATRLSNFIQAFECFLEPGCTPGPEDPSRGSASSERASSEMASTSSPSMKAVAVSPRTTTSTRALRPETST